MADKEKPLPAQDEGRKQQKNMAHPWMVEGERKNSDRTGVSSDVPKYSILNSPLTVNRAAGDVEIKRDATLGGGGDGKPAGRSGASSVASRESIFGFLPNVNGVNLADQYAWQMPASHRVCLIAVYLVFCRLSTGEVRG